MLNETEWALSEVRNNVETLIFRKNLEPNKDRDLSSYKYVIYFTCGCKTEPPNGEMISEEDGDSLEKIEEIELLSVAAASSSILVGVVTAHRVKDFILYSADPEKFLNNAHYIVSKYPQFDIGCQYNDDANWDQYRDLPPNGDC